MEDAKKNAGIVEEIVGEMIPALAKKSEKVQKKADKASEKKSAKSLRKLMEKVVAARAEHAASRAQMLDRGCASFSDFQSSVSVVRDACCGRVTAMKRGFDLVKDEYSRLAQRLRNCGASLKEKAEKIDFRSDFEKFVAETKIIRYDLECLPFESVDTSHPAFAGIETRINVAVPPLYPLALAKVVHSFAPENANEIACTKGKYVLLMEKADEEWVFVQNPVTNAMGYAPSACFEEVGDTIGVFIEQPDAETVRDARVSLGDYVAVIGNAKDDKLVVVTTRGLTTSVDSKVIGIITS